MEPDQMGPVVTEAKFENLKDLWAVEHGHRSPDEARAVTIPDALVDPEAIFLSLPTALIERLGLSRGPSKTAFCDPVRLTIQGRTCTMDVMEVPDGVPALIGHLPLLHLDFVVDFRGRALIGNPAHGGEHMYDV